MRSLLFLPALLIAAAVPVAAMPQTPTPAGVRIGPDGPIVPPPATPDAPRRDEPRVYRVVVSNTAVEPNPPLRFRFAAASTDLKPGNSVPFIYRAIVMLGGEAGEHNRKFTEGYDRFSERPLADLPRDEVRELLGQYRSVFAQLERAAEREGTDWSWHLEELSGDDSISFLLPEIQQARQLARVLHLKARLEIVEGRYDDAVATLRVGYRLGRDVAQPPIIINALVGIAIDSIMHSAAMELIAADGSPNLYWALATLPTPVIDMTPAMEYELGLPERFAPWLRDPESVARTPAQWRDVFRGTLVEFGRVNGVTFDPATEDGRLAASLGVTGLALRSYPAAKRRLIETGRDAAAVEAMPVGAVLAVAEKQALGTVHDELQKGFYLAAPASKRVIDRAATNLKADGLLGSSWTNEPLPIASVLYPAITQATRAELRLDARTAGLRAVEAVRMHAATTGRLPKSLAEIEVVPVPADPQTGEPFPYRLDAETAVLEVNAAPESPAYNWRVEFTLKK